MPDAIRIFTEGKDADVYVVLRVTDLMALRPDWEQVDAAGFLRICGNHLAYHMLDAGTRELARLIRVGEELLAQEEEDGKDA